MTEQNPHRPENVSNAGQPVHPEESWPSWEARVAAELAALTHGGFLTFTAAPGDPSGAEGHAAPQRQGWRRRLTRGRGVTAAVAVAPAATTEVLLQARVIEAVLALECIGDTEFEGLSDLTPAQLRQLVALGWEQDGNEPTFSATFSLAESGSAATLLARSLSEVLGALQPSQVDSRHS